MFAPYLAVQIGNAHEIFMEKVYIFITKKTPKVHSFVSL